MGSEEESQKKSKWLADRLYKACDYMRGEGSIMRTDYRSYLFPLIFFKRISDVYDEECEDLRMRVPDDDFVMIQKIIGSIFPKVVTGTTSERLPSISEQNFMNPL